MVLACDFRVFAGRVRCRHIADYGRHPASDHRLATSTARFPQQGTFADWTDQEWRFGRIISARLGRPSRLPRFREHRGWLAPRRERAIRSSTRRLNDGDVWGSDRRVHGRSRRCRWQRAVPADIPGAGSSGNEANDSPWMERITIRLLRDRVDQGEHHRRVRRARRDHHPLGGGHLICGPRDHGRNVRETRLLSLGWRTRFQPAARRPT